MDNQKSENEYKVGDIVYYYDNNRGSIIETRVTRITEEFTYPNKASSSITKNIYLYDPSTGDNLYKVHYFGSLNIHKSIDELLENLRKDARSLLPKDK